MDSRFLRASAGLLAFLALFATFASTGLAQQFATTTGGVAKSAGPTFPESIVADPRLPDSGLPTNLPSERAEVSRDGLIDRGATSGDPEIAQKGDENANQ